jgi:hypothetical protein
MLHKKAKLSVVFLLGIALAGLQAQTLFVQKKSGILTTLALNNISKLNFAEGNLMINRTDGSSGVYAMSDIRYLSFTDYGTNVSEQKFQQGSGILLYPNPAENILQIKYESEIPVCMQIRIVDVQGRLVKQLEQNYQSGLNNPIIDVSGLQCGFYLFRMQIGNKTEIARFVKK